MERGGGGGRLRSSVFTPWPGSGRYRMSMVSSYIYSELKISIFWVEYASNKYLFKENNYRKVFLFSIGKADKMFIFYE